MKKLTLLLALVGGVSLSSMAGTQPGKMCGVSTQNGVITICCKGSGVCFKTTTKPPRLYDDVTFVITTYTGGDENQIEGEYEVFDFSTTPPDAEGATTTSGTLVP